jgi:hypothetical protein
LTSFAEDVQLDFPIEDQINRARRNVLVHSIIYYVYNENIISDYEYDQWGKRLIYLQSRFPLESENTPFLLDIFREFSGTTSGFDLPLKDPYGDRTARWLLEQRDQRRDK